MADERTPEEYRAFFAEVFAALDATPRTMKVKVFGEGLTIDLVDGDPVFKTVGGSAKADFRLRWLAEHPTATSHFLIPDFPTKMTSFEYTADGDKSQNIKVLLYLQVAPQQVCLVERNFFLPALEGIR